MDFFDNKCFQYGVNHCKTTFISCLCLSKEGWDTKLSRLVCSVQDRVGEGDVLTSNRGVTSILTRRLTYCKINKVTHFSSMFASFIVKIKTKIYFSTWFKKIIHEWFKQRATIFYSTQSSLSCNLSSPCLAYGSHKLPCLNYVGHYRVGGRERKAVVFTVPSHGIWPQCCC